MADKKQKKEITQSKKDKQAPKTKEVFVDDKSKIVCRLNTVYKNEIVPALMKKLNYKSIMQVPKLDKIVVNMGVGDSIQDPKILEEAIKDLETVTGQKCSIRKSKKAISNFKLREGMSIGVMVTLRKDKMYEFLDRLINIALPRVRDFKGVSDKSFDGRGNYTLGIKEQIVFPEINVDKVVKVLGMDVTLVTTANTDNEAFELLNSFGFPFRKKDIQ